MTESSSSLDTAADELYSLPPQQFTTRRDEMSKSVRDAGDRELAGSIKALKRPTTAAWLLNLAVHADLPDLSELITVGAALRQAQADLDGPRMKELSGRRQHIEGAILSAVRRLAAQNDYEVPPQASLEVEETLRAAVADPAAAAAVASGHLTRALSYAGFGGVDLTDATATPLRESERASFGPKATPSGKKAPSKKETRKKPATKKAPAKKAATKKTPPDELAARRAARREEEERRAAEQKAERDAERLRDLESALEEAQAAAEQADQRHLEAEEAERQAEELVEDLHHRLQDARESLSDATKQAASVGRERDRAHRALRSAERQLARAQQERERD